MLLPLIIGKDFRLTMYPEPYSIPDLQRRRKNLDVASYRHIFRPSIGLLFVFWMSGDGPERIRIRKRWT